MVSVLFLVVACCNLISSHDLSNSLELTVYLSTPAAPSSLPKESHLRDVYTLCNLLLGDISVDKTADTSMSEYLAAMSATTAKSIIEVVFSYVKVPFSLYHLYKCVQDDFDSMRYFCVSLMNIQQKLSSKLTYYSKLIEL